MRLVNFFSQNKLPLKHKRLLLAVSGGPDSMALLAKLLGLRKQYQFELIAAHFDHQLRPDSSSETTLLVEYCRQHDVLLVNQKWAKSAQSQSGLEAAAREQRYNFLVAQAQAHACDYLLTAHHGDDLLENILLKFVRSGIPGEMDSLPAVSWRQGVCLLRPLLTYQKEELLKYDQVHGVPFIEDTTNFADDTLRNRLRHHVVPLLKRENPGLVKNAQRFSQEMGLLKQFSTQALAQIPIPQSFLGIAYWQPVSELAKLTPAEQHYYWQNFIWHHWHIRVNQHLPGFKLVAYQGNNYLYQEPLPKIETIRPILLDQKFTFAGQKYVVTNKLNKTLTLLGDFWAPEVPLTAGTLANAAEFTLKNGSHTKSKKKFAQSKIPAILRPYCLTVYALGQPVFTALTYQNQLVDRQNLHYYVYLASDHNKNLKIE